MTHSWLWTNFRFRYGGEADEWQTSRAECCVRRVPEAGFPDLQIPDPHLPIGWIRSDWLGYPDFVHMALFGTSPTQTGQPAGKVPESVPGHEIWRFMTLKPLFYRSQKLKSSQSGYKKAFFCHIMGPPADSWQIPDRSLADSWQSRSKLPGRFLADSWQTSGRFMAES